MKRIMIIGCGGAGKSTLARQLHEKTGLPLIHLDKHYWLPNWVESDKKAWKQKVQQFAHEEDWIIDGNYGGTMDIRLERATTVIFLDRSRWLCLYRVMMRLLKNKGQTRMDMGAGCKERFNWEFMSYVFHYNETRRPKIIKRLAELKETQEVIILKNDKSVKSLLKRVK